MVLSSGQHEVGVAGVTVRVVGEGTTKEIRTDANLAYEVYGLAPGHSVVRVKPPDGWVLAYYRLPDLANRRQSDARPTTADIPVDVKVGRLAERDIDLRPDIAIRGTLIDPSGTPLKDVCLSVLRTDNEKEAAFDRTDESGRFAITELEPASYVLAVNENGVIDGVAPFGTFFYPGPVERDRASVLTVGFGEPIVGLEVRVPDARRGWSKERLRR